jgi:hypothetical protein
METKTKTSTKEDKEAELNQFLQSLNEKQRKAFEIAKQHFGSSFDYYRSNGFIDWKNTHPSNQP